jgi:hypothetical protein
LNIGSENVLAAGVGECPVARPGCLKVAGIVAEL